MCHFCVFGRVSGFPVLPGNVMSTLCKGRREISEIHGDIRIAGPESCLGPTLRSCLLCSSWGGRANRVREAELFSNDLLCTGKPITRPPATKSFALTTYQASPLAVFLLCKTLPPDRAPGRGTAGGHWSEGTVRERLAEVVGRMQTPDAGWPGL